MGLFQAYILFCLQSRDNHAPVFGLVAVRLASLNQTLNPWIYVILRKSLLSRFRRVCCSCLRDSDPPLPHRKPQQYLPVHRQPPAQGKGRPHNYVHVRHQLCPSSQFVGQHSDAASLSEGHRKQPKGSENSSNNNSGSRGRKSKCEKSRGGKGTWSSESVTGDEKRRVAGSASCSCSACRAAARGGEPDACCSSSRRSLSCSHPSCCRGGEEPCGAQQVPGASTVSGAPLHDGAAPSSSTASEPKPALLPTADGIYVDLFRQLSGSEVSDRRDATTSPDRSDVSQTTTSPCRSVTGRGGAAASVNVNSSTSEADDHGYVSRVSTESSRTSTPESHRSARGKTGEDGAGVLIAQRDVGCSEAADRRSATAAAAAEEEEAEEEDEGAPVVASGCKDAIPEHRALRHVKHKGCEDDSEGFSSGVFLDSQDGSVDVCADCDGGDCGEGKVRGREGVVGGGGGSCSRTLSNSSAGTHTESSSGHDRSAAFSRQLSTSSAQRSDS